MTPPPDSNFHENIFYTIYFVRKQRSKFERTLTLNIATSKNKKRHLSNNMNIKI